MYKRLLVSVAVLGVVLSSFSGCGLFKRKWDIHVQNMTTGPATFVWDGTPYSIEPLRMIEITDVKQGKYNWSAEWEEATQSGEVEVDRNLYIRIYPTGVIIEEWVGE